MDRNWNEDPEGASFEFVLVLPWYKEGRLVGISALGLGIILVLAALAVNRHGQLVKSYARSAVSSPSARANSRRPIRPSSTARK